MKYSETELTEAIKIISYLKSIRTYAVAILLLSLLYIGFKIHKNTTGTELYLLYYFTGVIILGSLSAVINLNNMTANIYGVSCIIAGVIYSFSIIYYRGETEGFYTAIGLFIGLIVIRQGVSVAFGNHSKEVFTTVNQKKVSFVKKLLKSLKQPLPNEDNVILCTYLDEGEKRNLRIKLLDDVACFLLNGHATPVFFNRNDIYISELQDNPDFIKVSVIVDNHDWLEAQFKPNDFKKYEVWKEK